MSEMSEDFERRLVELENKNSYQEAELLDFSKALLDQDNRIERLEASLRALRDRVKELGGEGQPPLPANERPPHY
jgi:uncharacterized coiled-coil protein SlyX